MITLSRKNDDNVYPLVITDGIVKMTINCKTEDEFMMLATEFETLDVEFSEVWP